MNSSKTESTITAQHGELTRHGVGGQRWGRTSIFLNLKLSFLNQGIIITTGSLAIVSEMIPSVVDLMASAVILIGLGISQWKSSSFPYGLYKMD